MMKQKIKKPILNNTADGKAVLDIREDGIMQSAIDGELRELYSTRRLISKFTNGIMATYIFDVLYPQKTKNV